MENEKKLEELKIEVNNSIDSLQNVKYVIDKILQANQFKVGDEVTIKDCALTSSKNDGLPLLVDVIFIIEGIFNSTNKALEKVVDLRYDECRARHYTINDQSLKLVDEGSYKIEQVPISAIQKAC